MAGSGATIQALGRTLPDNGPLSDTLVVKDGTIVQNLISIPKFDRLGYTTVFTGGKGTVYDCEGNIIVTAELSSNDLYEFDIRDLYRSRAEQAYLSSFESCMIVSLIETSAVSDMPSERSSFICQKNSQRAQKNRQIASVMPVVVQSLLSTRNTGVKTGS